MMMNMSNSEGGVRAAVNARRTADETRGVPNSRDELVNKLVEAVDTPDAKAIAATILFGADKIDHVEFLKILKSCEKTELMYALAYFSTSAAKGIGKELMKKAGIEVEG